MRRLLQRFQRRGRITFTQLQLLYVFTLFLTLHSAIPMYGNSGFLETFLEPETVGIVFSAASVVTLFALLNLPRLLKRWGVYTTTSVLIMMEIFTLLVLGTSHLTWLTILAFITFLCLARCLYYTLDIFVENL